MSMTLEEVAKRLKGLKNRCERLIVSRSAGSPEEWRKDAEAVEIAISALRPVSREQVEKVWRGEWEDMREAYKDVPKRRCSRCKNVFIGLDTPFCEVCGAPMTDEAVEMVMERLEALKDGSTTD